MAAPAVTAGLAVKTQTTKGRVSMFYDFIECLECDEETVIKCEQGEFGLEPIEDKEFCDHCGAKFLDLGCDENAAERKQLGFTAI
jgi:hypothetical protein